MPKVSVVIPLYNGERFIRNAIESVLCQTVQDFELIVVDDGSKDRGKDIVLDMKDPITYIYQDNSGTAAARNRGFLNSHGDYIAFLDQDDRWYPQKLETQIWQLDDNPQIGIVYSDIDVIDEVENTLEHGYLRNRIE
ncbi:MAG: glycosyltransferase family 2 protein, partial [Gallionellaceae bacterium]